MSTSKNRIGKAVCIALLISLLIVLCSPNATTSALLRGDFPGFYVLGKIVAEGRISELYNLNLQRQIQNQAWPELGGNFLISVYPPSLAILLAPLGFLSPGIAQLVFSSLSCVCLFLSFLLLKDRISFLKDSPWLLVALLVSNPFILIGTLGGQNTAFSILIISLGAGLLEKSQRDHSARTEILAGLLFSLWLFKPQFGIFLVPAFIFFRLWKALFGFSVGALAHYFAGTLLLGPLWPVDWARKLAEFSALNYSANDFNQASIIGTANVFARFLGMNSSLISILSISAVVLMTLCLLLILSKRGRQGGPSAFISSFWCFMATVPLMAPQTLFYDIGITFYALLNCLARPISKLSERSILFSLVFLQLICWSAQLFRTVLPVPLFLPIALIYFGFSAKNDS